jgi:hypothetical protein
MTNRGVWVLLAFLIVVVPALAGKKKVVALTFEPAHTSKTPCPFPFQPFLITQELDPFFKDLEQVKVKGKRQYRRRQDIVTNFPDTTSVAVVFSPSPTPLGACADLPPFDPAKVKFHVEWRDGPRSTLGEGTYAQSKESSSDIWCEQACTQRWKYELSIDSQDVPLTEELVVTIEAENGARLAEFVGKVGAADLDLLSQPHLLETATPAP